MQAQILELLEDIRDNTALLLITHDLGIVAGRCERMLVFEKGRLVDSGPTTSLFASPGNAHTRALLDVVPVPDPVVSVRAAPLKGEVASLISPPSGCVFHPRCGYAKEICVERVPESHDVAGSRVACHRAEEIEL